MDAELYNKGLKMICGRQNRKCWVDVNTNVCMLFDQATSDCCAAPNYRGNKKPIPIVAQWLAEHPEEEITKMKSTGIIRRIDDLGRIVIPKEIRRTMQIGEGDPLEVGVVDNEVRLTKYAPEPKPLPELPEKVSINPFGGPDYELYKAVNAIIDYLAAQEEQNGKNT